MTITPKFNIGDKVYFQDDGDLYDTRSFHIGKVIGVELDSSEILIYKIQPTRHACQEICRFNWVYGRYMSLDIKEYITKRHEHIKDKYEKSFHKVMNQIEESLKNDNRNKN